VSQRILYIETTSQGQRIYDRSADTVHCSDLRKSRSFSWSFKRGKPRLRSPSGGERGGGRTPCSKDLRKQGARAPRSGGERCPMIDHRDPLPPISSPWTSTLLRLSHGILAAVNRLMPRPAVLPSPQSKTRLPGKSREGGHGLVHYSLFRTNEAKMPAMKYFARQ
jgi:hypothetical protein